MLVICSWDPFSNLFSLFNSPAARRMEAAGSMSRAPTNAGIDPLVGPYSIVGPSMTIHGSGMWLTWFVLHTAANPSSRNGPSQRRRVVAHCSSCLPTLEGRCIKLWDEEWISPQFMAHRHSQKGYSPAPPWAVLVCWSTGVRD